MQATHNNQIKKDALRAPIMGVTEGLLVAQNGSSGEQPLTVGFRLVPVFSSAVLSAQLHLLAITVFTSKETLAEVRILCALAYWAAPEFQHFH